jgi:cobyrinic acid a,c-diamide synthase
VPSRHLGLIPAAERAVEARRVVAELADVIAHSVDLNAVERLAGSAPPLAATSPIGRAVEPTVRVAVAAGPAFTFGYAEQAELLAAAGAEVVPFDPARDERLPPQVAGLVIGGGFPEVHAADLAANEPLRREITALAATGAPIAAECAGLLYLARTLDGQPMCGVLDVEAEMTDRLTLGYREAVAPADSVLAAAGTRVRGHEFHRTRCTPAAGAVPAWRWGRDAADGFIAGGVHASYLHLHWAAAPQLADRFVAAARRVAA